ncbi:MAG: glycosyltransferase [Candidatus Eisenbacteria bacterium]|nr:glycosyltransferase [Candidatus Eisenbacteria bacterium]
MSKTVSRSDGRVRVLQLITRLIVGGAQENTIAAAGEVDRGRFESELWTGPQAGSEGSLLDDARRRCIPVTIIPNLVREISPFKDILVTAQLARMMRARRFDIVVTHSSKAGIVGRVAARLAGVPHVTHVHHGWGFHDRMHPLVRWFYAGIERAMSWITWPLVSVSERTTRVGLDAHIGRPASYRLIRSGIPLADFYPDDQVRERVRTELGVSRDEILVGSVGRLSPQKNPHDFVRVARGTFSRHENARFVYVGDGPLRAEIEAAVSDAGLDGKLELLGLRHDVPDLLRAFDLFILTSLWEGLPRVVPQALATGVPVVAYDIAGIEESVIEGRNGHLVRPEAVEEMVERLDRLISDASLRAEMSRRAIEEFDESFSERAMVRNYEQLFEDLVSGRESRAAHRRRAAGRPSSTRR